MHSQFNLMEAASFSTSPFKPSKSCQMSPFQSHGNNPSSAISRVHNNNNLSNSQILGKNPGSNRHLMTPSNIQSILVPPNNNLKSSNRKIGGSKSHQKDNPNESLSSELDYAQHISNFDTSLQHFPNTSNIMSTNQYFQNYFHGGFGLPSNNGNASLPNHQPFSFEGNSPFRQRNSHQMMSQHHLPNHQQNIQQNGVRGHSFGCYDEGQGNNQSFRVVGSDNEQIPMQHLEWLEKKAFMQKQSNNPQTKINEKRKRDTLPPSTAASSIKFTEESSQKRLKKVAVDKNSEQRLQSNNPRSSSQKQEQSHTEEENRVRTRGGGLIRKMKLQREQILLSEKVSDQEESQQKKSKKSMEKTKVSRKDNSIEQTPMKKKRLNMQEDSIFEQKKTSSQEQGSKKSKRIKSSEKKVSQKVLDKERKELEENEQVKNKKGFQRYLETGQDRQRIRSWKQQHQIQIGDENIEEEQGHRLDPKSEEEYEKNQLLGQLQMSSQTQEERFHDIQFQKSRTSFKIPANNCNPANQSIAEKGEQEAAAAKKVHDIKQDQKIRQLFDEAEKMGREYSVIGAQISSLVNQIRSQYLDQQILSTFANRNQQMLSYLIQQQQSTSSGIQQTLPVCVVDNKKSKVNNKTKLNLQQNK